MSDHTKILKEIKEKEEAGKNVNFALLVIQENVDCHCWIQDNFYSSHLSVSFLKCSCEKSWILPQQRFPTSGIKRRHVTTSVCVQKGYRPFFYPVAQRISSSEDNYSKSSEDFN